MAKHWSEYVGSALTDRQIGALDAMAREHDFADGLALLAAANGMSRSSWSSRRVRLGKGHHE